MIPNYLVGLPAYIVGILTYHYWMKLRKEMNCGEGGEIQRIIKLKI